jgi:ABC-type multidrug transport system permease subunit
MLRQVWAIVKKEMRILFRRKSNWFFLIGFPLGLTLVTGYVFGSLFPGGQEAAIHIDVGIINQDTSVSPIREIESVSKTLIDEMNKTEVFKPVYLFGNVSEALEQLKRGQLDAVMVIHQNFTWNIVVIKQANMTIYVDSSTDPQRYQVVKSVLNTFTAEVTRKITQGRIDVVKPYISVLDPVNQTFVIESMWAMSEPVGIEIIDTAVIKFRYVEWLLPGILGLEAIFGGLMFSGGAIAEERERGHLRRMLVSPTSSWAVLVGEMIWSLIRVSFAFIIVISVNIVVFNVYNINWAPQLVIPIIILTTLSASGLGLIISVASKTSETASGLTNMATFILQFLVGSYLPTHMLGVLEPIAKYLPWSIANETLRRIMVNYGYYTEIAPLIAYLTVVTFAFLAIGAYLYKVTNKRYI